MRCGTYLRRDKSVWRDSVTEHSRETRGKLTVFLGAAAGVGKTYTMLETARQRLTEGVDVAVGWVETHGRPEMEQLLDGLPRIMPQDGRQQGAYPSEAAESPLSERAALALDVMEEFRPWADRLALTLINRGQVQADDFDLREGGGVTLQGDARKAVVVAYQERKKDEITHPLLAQSLPLGLVPLVQARLLARALRDDAMPYLPFVPK